MPATGAPEPFARPLAPYGSEVLLRTQHVLVAILFLIPAGHAQAQTAADSTWTFGGTAGYGRTWDDEGGIGSGALLGGYADRRLTKRLDVEVSADLLKNRRTDAFQADGWTTYLAAQLVGRFGPRTSNFFLMAGPALAIHRGTTRFSDGTFHQRHESTNTGWMAGTGLSFRTRNDIEVAPLVRITMMNIDTDSDPWATITGAIRVGFGR